MRGVRPGGRAFVAMVFALCVFGPLSSDLYLPAMPALAAELRGGDIGGQLSLTACLLGLGVGQLVWGPLSDKVGRRGPLIVGIALFSAASALSFLSSTIEMLILARTLQGIGGAAGIVLARAAIRDVFEGPRLGRMFSFATVVTGSVAVLAPIVGSGILELTDWRGTFAILSVAGAVLLIWAVVFMPETFPPSVRRTRRAHIESHPLRSAQFVLFVGVFVAACGALFAYITSISFVAQIEYGLSSTGFAILFALNALGIIVGGQVAGQVVSRGINPQRIMVAALGAAVVGCVGVTVVIVGGASVLVLQAFLLLVTLSVGCAMPMATTIALTPFRSAAGSAASILGGAQYLVGGLVPGAVVAVFGGSGTVMAFTMLALVGLASVLAVIAMRLPEKDVLA